MKLDLGKIHGCILAFIFTLGGAISLFLGLLFLITGKELGLGAMGAGFALLVASMLGRFESFKVWGVEAKLRKLDEAVVRAKDATLQLKDVAELTWDALLRLHCSSGRYVRPLNMIELARISEDSRSMLTRLGSSADDIEKLLRPWVKTSALVAHRNVREALGEIIEQRRAELIKRKFIASPEELQSILPRLNVLEGYIARESERAQDCATSEIPLLISEMVEKSPEISAEEKNYLRVVASKAAEEVRYLIDNLELRDRSYWGSLRYQ